MHRTQFSLDEPLYEALRRRAFDRRVSMSEVVREALADYLGLEPLPTARDDEAGAPDAPDAPAD